MITIVGKMYLLYSDMLVVAPGIQMCVDSYDGINFCYFHNRHATRHISLHGYTNTCMVSGMWLFIHVYSFFFFGLNIKLLIFNFCCVCMIRWLQNEITTPKMVIRVHRNIQAFLIFHIAYAMPFKLSKWN